MKDNDKLINDLLKDLKMGKKDFQNKVYSDQPLLRRASEIKRPAVPQKIKDMKALSYTPESYWNTSSWLFYTQGNFMADYTDDFDYSGNFQNMFPTYSGFSTEQLRGYFTWRTHIRNGNYTTAPAPFILLYVYEIINMIGIRSAEEGFYKLLEIYDNYGGVSFDLYRSLKNWISDFAIYYDLGRSEFEKCPAFKTDEHLLKLVHYSKTSDDELFDAMLKLSDYSGRNSDFFVNNTENFKIVAVRSFRSLSEFFRTHRKNSLFEKYFGKATDDMYRMFDSAVFHQVKHHKNIEIKINEIRSYSCKNNIWSCREIKGTYSKRQNIYNFLFTTERIMREKCDPVPARYYIKSTKITDDIIRKVLAGFEEEQRIRKASEIKLDLSKLSSIRADSEITQEKLLTESDISDISPESEAVPEIEIAEEPETEITVPTEKREKAILNEVELNFLDCLLNGRNWLESARISGNMPSVLSDSINEKLFDSFGDTVIDFSGDVPMIVEDYADDIHMLIKNGEL